MLVVCWLFDNAYSGLCEALSCCGFELLSLMLSDVCLPMYLLAVCLSSLKNVYSGLLPIFLKLCCLFFDVELYEYDIYKYILCVLT